MERNLSERILVNFASKSILALIVIAVTVVAIYAFLTSIQNEFLNII